MTIAPSRSARPDSDPALLAFIKCHVNSVAKWDALCVLSREVGRWHTLEQLRHHLTISAPKVVEALDGLVADGVVETRPHALGTLYRVPADDPTTIVVERLFNAARVDQNLRRIVVARVMHQPEA